MTRRHATAGVRARAVAAYLAGSSAADVAWQIGAHSSSVLGWVRAAGHTARAPGRAPAHRNADDELAAAGRWVVRRGIKVLIPDNTAATP